MILFKGKSAYLRTGITEVVALVVKSRPSIANALGGRVTSGMASVSLAFNRRMQVDFAARL